MNEIEGETWKYIPGFPSYMVSSMGRFKRNTLSGHIELKGKVDRVGYQQIGLVRNKKQHWFLAHRVVACTFSKPEFLTSQTGEFLTVNHKNRVKTDNRFVNLELITVAQNHQHWRRHSLKNMAQCEGDIGSGPSNLVG